jgi:hypothetical protein
MLALLAVFGGRPSPSFLQSAVEARSVAMKCGGRGQKRQPAPASPGGAGGGSRQCVGAGVGGNVAGAIVGPSAAQSMSDVFKLNATYLADLDVAWQKVNGHPVFQGLPRMYTPPIGMTGFDNQQFTSSIEQHGTYTCGGTLFWADLFYTGTPGVPINRRAAPVLICACRLAKNAVRGHIPFPYFGYHIHPRSHTHMHRHTRTDTHKVEYYMSYFFHRVHPGIAFPTPVHIAVIGDLTPAVAGNLGNLKAISPEEPRHALVFAIARDIDAGLTDDELLWWKNLVVSAIITFKTVDTEDDIFWLATNARESVGAQFEVVYFSAVPPCPRIHDTPLPHAVTLQPPMPFDICPKHTQ